MRGRILALLVGLAMLSGCVAAAKEEFAKLKVGMNEEQVGKVLGKPEAVSAVRFAGHDRDYTVWQYEMVPNTPLCPSEAIPRFVSGLATAGLSEIAWTHAQAEPHWIYFLDGAMVYTSPAFDCQKSELCKVNRKSGDASSRN